MTLGDSLSKSIDHGLAGSKYGIVILSPHFFAKQWPQRELSSLATLEMTNTTKKIFPVWHKVDAGYIGKYSPVLGDKIGVPTSKGIDLVLQEIKRAFEPERQLVFSCINYRNIFVMS